MSTRSNVNSKANRSNRRELLDRPFDPQILRRAVEVSRRYRLVLEPDDEVGFIGHALELPSVFADGRTAEACVRATVEALTGTVAFLLESGQIPPAPLARARDAQINVRVTAEEKLVLEQKARRSGFRGVSDFVRAAALASDR